jgi:hypothetical protein
LETATTAPPMAVSTTPPETMLRRKLLSDADSPGCAASATSGTTSAAATAAAAAHSFTGWRGCAEARTAADHLRGEARSEDALAAASGFPSPRATDRDAATEVTAMELGADLWCAASESCTCDGNEAGQKNILMHVGFRREGLAEVTGQRSLLTWMAFIAPNGSAR